MCNIYSSAIIYCIQGNFCPSILANSVATNIFLHTIFMGKYTHFTMKNLQYTNVLMNQPQHTSKEINLDTQSIWLFFTCI